MTVRERPLDRAEFERANDTHRMEYDGSAMAPITWVATTAMILSVGVPVPAAAQSPSALWQVEPYGGLSAPFASAGSQTLPAAGAPIVTSNPTFPSRAVPSWFFGDGASLLNGVNADFGVAARAVPLDSALQGLHPGPAGAFGVRVRRRLTPRYSAEIDVGLSTGRTVGEELQRAVEATRTGFVSGVSGLLTSGPFTNANVTATGSASTGHERDVHATMAVNVRLRSWRQFDPDVTLGGGVVTIAGGLPSATLDGHYQFAILGTVPIDETDHLVARYTRGAAAVAVAGVGLTRALNNRWAIRFDARCLLGPDSTRILIDTAPSSVRGTPSGFIESFTNPSIQFSNDPSTGRVSSLSAPALQGASVFSGGFQVRTMITVGIVRRF